MIRIERSLLRRAAAVLVSASFVAAVAGAQNDTVTLRDGTTEQGRIKSEDYEGLSIESRQNSKTIEWNKVASIAYDKGGELAAAKESLDGGRLDEALAAYQAVRDESRVRPVIKQNAMFQIARIQQQKGAFDEALAAYADLVKEFPKSRYLMDVGEGLVACHLGKKNPAAADQALQKLATDALAGGVAASFGSAIKVISGRLLEEQQKYAEAQAAYGVAERATGVPVHVQQLARLGQGRCLVQLKKLGEAEALFRKLTTEEASNPVLAGAWNGLGLVWRSAGMELKDKEQIDKLKNALFAYMRGVVLYAPLPGESSDAYLKSLEGTRDLWTLLSQVEKKPDLKRTYQQFANQYKAQIEREFGS